MTRGPIYLEDYIQTLDYVYPKVMDGSQMYVYVYCDHMSVNTSVATHGCIKVFPCGE